MTTEPTITSKQKTPAHVRKFNVCIGLDYKGSVSQRRLAAGWETEWTAITPTGIVGTFASFDDAVSALAKS